MAFNLPYNYPWQNPVLRETTYPYRLQKLRDFLLIYEEIDLQQRFKNAPIDPALEQEIRQDLPGLQAELQHNLDQRKALQAALSLLLKKLNQIERVPEIRKLVLQIAKLEQETAQLNIRRRLLEGYIQWSLKIAPLNDPVRPKRQAELELVRAQIAELGTQIASLKQDYNETFLPLKDQEDKIEASTSALEQRINDLTARLQGFPPFTTVQAVTPKIAARWSLNKYRKQLEGLEHDEILALVLERFQRQPERYPGWLQYMVIHFSGMRYKSAHGSWADPRLLLQKILEMELEQHITAADEDQILQAAGEVISHLQKILEQSQEDTIKNQTARWIQKLSVFETTQLEIFRSHPGWEALFDDLRQIEKKIANLTQLFTTSGMQPNHSSLTLIAELEAQQHQTVREIGWVSISTIKKRLAAGLYWLKNNLLAYRLERMEDALKEMTDLEILSSLAVRQAQLPGWAWNEIVRRSNLRLATTDPAWETVSREEQKQKYSNQSSNPGWRQLIYDWERRDITAWRAKHAQDLSLVVSRAVCNEISEHIQHLRGRKPPGGLTAKPLWYLANQDTLSGLAFFKRPEQGADFKPGASLLFLGWVSSKPNAWAIASPLRQFALIMPDGQPLRSGWSDANGVYQYQIVGSEIYRTSQVDVAVQPASPIPQATIKSQRKQMTKGQQTSPKRAIERAKTAPKKFRKQQRAEWLRWTHEATVVEVAEMIDGINVLTFETGEIGLNIRPMKRLIRQWDVYLGFVPAAETERPELPSFLEHAKLLPQDK